MKVLEERLCLDGKDDEIIGEKGGLENESFEGFFRQNMRVL